ncbi:(4Fe-4S)-binding protein [Bacteroidia bacterium]|nr:(4Fe-4S)-binding protein [Bacteroidia bacterium]GHT47813.1 (4Fe-4S)-binding protein [Bacteroidia bacterium]
MKKVSKLAIFYFSGTGNAKQIALWFSEYAGKQGIDCRLCSISTADPITTIHSDTLIIFISPVHGFNYPKITLDFIRRFPKGNNRVVLMCTRAGMRIGNIATPGLTGIAFFVSNLLLRTKGYTIAGQIPFDMPSNWIAIHPTLSRKTVRFLFETNFSHVQKHAEQIFAGKKDFLSHRDLVQDVLVSPIALGYYIAGRFFLAKQFYASAQCNNCGLCINQCPVKAIKRVGGRPFWTFRCESCMKCMSRCPQKAIEVAHGLWLVLIILSSVFTPVFFLIIGFLYRLQHLLLANRFFGKIITFTSLTHYKIWGKGNPKSNRIEQQYA